MATIAEPPADRRSAERKFYSRWRCLAAIVLVGFGPSFYLRGIVPSYPRPNPTLPMSVLLHGALFTLWMLVFVAQTQLVTARRVDLHMKLGKAAMVLALAIIPMMYLTSVWQVARATSSVNDPLHWTGVRSCLPAYAIPGLDRAAEQAAAIAQAGMLAGDHGRPWARRRRFGSRPPTRALQLLMNYRFGLSCLCC